MISGSALKYQPVLPGDISEREPPDPFSNSEVKTFSADGSVGSPHVRVGHRQAFNTNPNHRKVVRVFPFGRPVF